MSPNLPTGSYLLALIQLGPLPKKSRKIIVRGKGLLKKKRSRNQRQVSPSNCVLGLLEAPLPPLVWFIAMRLYLLLFFQSSNNQGHAKCCMQVCAHTETDVALNLGWCLWLKRLFTYHLHWILKTYTSFGNWNSPISLLLALYSPPHPNKQPTDSFLRIANTKSWSNRQCAKPCTPDSSARRLHRKGIRNRHLVQFSPNLKTLFLLKNSSQNVIITQ